jgi:hypothetical protein
MCLAHPSFASDAKEPLNSEDLHHLTVYGYPEAEEGESQRERSQYYDHIMKSDDFGHTIRKFPQHNGTVYRGTTHSAVKGWEPGKTITTKRHLPTTVDQEKAQGYAGRLLKEGNTSPLAVLKINNARTHQIPQEHSGVEHQESILPKGSRLKILSRKPTNGGMHYIEAEHIS